MYTRELGRTLGYTELASAVSAPTPRIVLVPGIMGSQLVDSSSGKLLWGDMSMLNWAPSIGRWVTAMGQGNGVNHPGAVVPGGFIRFRFPLRSMAEMAAKATLSPALMLAIRAARLRNIDVHPYGKAMDFFVARFGTANVLPFPYDWRLANEYTAGLLKRAIERKWGDSLDDRSKPITLIAHSMGGLISRYYIEQLGGNRVVRNLVTVGTPHDGAPEGLRTPSNVSALASFLLPLDIIQLLTAPVPALAPLAIAMPALHLFVNTFLRNLQSMLLHFNSLYQLLPNRPFVYPTPSAGAFEPLATSFDTLRRRVCPAPTALICAKPMSDLRRLNDMLLARSRSLPPDVRYFPIISHNQPTTSACRRMSNGELTAIKPRCGDGTVPAASAVLPAGPTVRNRYIESTYMHSDLLHDQRVLDMSLNVARDQGALPVTGMNELAPPCSADNYSAGISHVVPSAA